MPGDVVTRLAARINAALPQTQCTRCGYPDCAAYAKAIAQDGIPINQCPPGGAEGIVRLATITGRLPVSLSAEHGIEAPRVVAFIDEAWCIGCTLCIKACPTDAIVGSNKMMHTVIEPHCTGCELCIPACPVDCIQLENVSGNATGWAAWSESLARHARQRYQEHRQRLPLEPLVAKDEQVEETAAPPSGEGVTTSQGAAPVGIDENSKAARQATIAEAIERARRRRTEEIR